MTEKETKKPETKTLEEIKAKAKAVYFDAEKKELKSLKEIFDRTTQVNEIWVDSLGCSVKVGHLSMHDLSEIMKIEDKNIMGLQMLYRILKSADKTVKQEWVYDLPIDVTQAMIETLMEEGLGFLKGSQLPKPKQDT